MPKISVTLTLMPSTEHLRDGRQPGDRGRDLDEQVGPVHQPPQRAGLGDGAARVVCHARVDLDRHPSVHAVRVRRRHRTQHVAGGSHVGRRQRRGGPRRRRPSRGRGPRPGRRRRRPWTAPSGRSSGWWSPRRTSLVATSSARLPVRRRSRLRSSSQMETPSAESRLSTSPALVLSLIAAAFRCAAWKRRAQLPVVSPLMAPTLSSDA